MKSTETVRMALTTLRTNRLRSFLTMVGIVIGNASVITLVGVGRGAQGLAEEQLSNLGANVLFVVPGNNDTRRRGVAFPKTLVLEDATAIAEQVPSVQTRGTTDHQQSSGASRCAQRHQFDLGSHRRFCART
jgi:putative ABC transport system permease protein